MAVEQKLYQAMLRVEPAPTDGATNRYEYASANLIVTMMREIFAEVGLIVVPVGQEILREYEMDASGSTMLGVRIKARYTLIDPNDGSRLDVQTLGEAASSEDKAVAAAETYAYKELLTQIGMITLAGPDSVPRGPLPEQKDEIERLVQGKLPDAKKLNVMIKGLTGQNVKIADLYRWQASALINLLRALPDRK